MHPEIQDFLSRLNAGVDLVLKNKVLFLVIALLDIAFFSGLVYFHTTLLVEASDSINSVLKDLQEQTNGLNETELLQFEQKLTENQEFMQKYKQLITYTGYFFGIAALLWIIFQGASLVIANKIVHKKIDYLKVYVLFLFWSFFWFAVSFAALLFLSSMAQPAGLGIGNFNLFYFLSNLVIAYFAFVSFSLVHRGFSIKLPFLVGQFYWKKLVPGFVLILVALFVLINVGNSIVHSNALAALIFSAVFIIPTLAFFRIYFINLVDSVVKNAELLPDKA